MPKSSLPVRAKSRKTGKPLRGKTRRLTSANRTIDLLQGRNDKETRQAARDLAEDFDRRSKTAATKKSRTAAKSLARQFRQTARVLGALRKKKK